MIDGLTRTVSRFVDFLFLDNPFATAMGALGGVFALFAVKIFRPTLEQLATVDLVHIHPILFICAGVFLANIPRAIRGDALPVDVEQRLLFIRYQIRERSISSIDGQRMYAEIVEDAALKRRGVGPSDPTQVV